MASGCVVTMGNEAVNFLLNASAMLSVQVMDLLRNGRGWLEVLIGLPEKEWN